VATPAAATHVLVGVRPADNFNLNPFQPAGGFRRALGWSPDGRTLGFIAQKDNVRRIYLRPLGSDEATPLAGTEGADTFAFSPDGTWIAFWVTLGGEIRKLPAGGGPVALVYTAGTIHGMTWLDRDHIVYAADRAIVEVNAGGGAPRTLRDIPTGRPASPAFLPGNKGLLFTQHEKGWTSGDERIMVQSLPNGEPRRLIDQAADATYVSSGHIVFLRRGTLFAVPFDPDRLELRGSEVAIISGVSQAVGAGSNSNLTLNGQYSVSPQGMLAYLASPLVGHAQSELVKTDRSGTASAIGAGLLSVTPIIGLSPTGDRLAVTVQTMTERTLRILEMKTSILHPLTKSGEFSAPVWMGDQRLAAIEFVDWTTRLGIFHLDTAAPMEVVPDSNGFWPTSWSPLTKCLAGVRGDARVYHVWTYCPDGPDPKFRQITESKGTEQSVEWSPDGRYLAYSSAANDKSEIFVRPYPSGPERQVSNNGGLGPAWNPKGHELFYLEPHSSADSRMMTVAIETTPALQAAAPRPVFTFQPRLFNYLSSHSNGYEVAPDGQHFYAIRLGPPPANPPVTQINLIVNWFEELVTRAPRR
jgi:serine/threonine-protein kinase